MSNSTIADYLLDKQGTRGSAEAGAEVRAVHRPSGNPVVLLRFAAEPQSARLRQLEEAIGRGVIFTLDVVRTGGRGSGP